jgi:oxidoreductase AflX
MLLADSRPTVSDSTFRHVQPKKWALFGATSTTGSTVLRSLLHNPPPDVELNVLVRSESKLLEIFPVLKKESLAVDLSIRIIDGAETDSSALEECIAATQVIMICVEPNERERSTTLYLNTASAIIAALQRLRCQQHTARPKGYQPPTIVQLRSASPNHILTGHVPKIAHKLVRLCLRRNDQAMRKACGLYESATTEAGAAAPTLLQHVFVDPPTMLDAARRDWTGYKLICCDKQHTALSYEDLGNAVVDIRQLAKQLCGQTVGVTVTGQVKEAWDVF